MVDVVLPAWFRRFVAMLSVVAGLAGGALHAISGPDHLAAIAPLSGSNRRAGLRVGLEWGLGHGVGVVVLATLAAAVRHFVDISAVSRWSELLVGVSLVMLSVWAAYRARVLSRSTMPERPRSQATFGVGALHGTAGASHLLALLPAAGLSTVPAFGFLIAYLFGAALAMAVVGAAAGEMFARGGAKWRVPLMYAASIMAGAVGIVWIVTSILAQG